MRLFWARRAVKEERGSEGGAGVDCWDGNLCGTIWDIGLGLVACCQRPELGRSHLPAPLAEEAVGAREPNSIFGMFCLSRDLALERNYTC